MDYNGDSYLNVGLLVLSAEKNPPTAKTACQILTQIKF